MIETMIVAIIRKALFIGILFGSYFLIDKYHLTGFDTKEVIKNDPKAIALLLGLLAIAIAFS